MNLLLTIVLLLICLLISNVISHYIPLIPTALTQIVFGITIALLFRDFNLEIETEWFLLLFVAPLLYNDGRHFPRIELWKMRRAIFGNAIVLVLITTIGGGFFIHWMIPGIPLAAAFALAAILSPTDPVAVNGIAKRIHIPEKILNLVRGESLINDASGLVAFNYAVIAVVTGYFSLKEAVFDFSYMLIAGVLTGFVLQILIIWIRFLLRKQGITDMTFHSLLQIMTPFIIFIIAEDLLHASGVIAVVTAGILHGLIREKTETIVAEEQLLTENTWSMVLFVLNGVVFLLLGLNIPTSMSEAVLNPNMGNWLIIGYVIALGIVILGIRFIWSFFTAYYEYHILASKNAERPNMKASLVTSLAGVRGAVTMAGVLSIPFTIASGAAFPERSLILFLASGVILFTLLAATVFLPLVSGGEAIAGEPNHYISTEEAKRKLLLAAVKKIREELNEKSNPASHELLAEYKRRFRQIHPSELSNVQDARSFQQSVTALRLMAIKAERAYIHDLMGKNRLDEDVFSTFEKALDHREEALSDNVRSETLFFFGLLGRAWRRVWFHTRKDKEEKIARIRLSRGIQLKAMQVAMGSLVDFAKEARNPDAVNWVIEDYKRLIEKVKHPISVYDEKAEEQKEELRLRVVDVQRAEIHRMYENGEIGRDQAKELRRFINYVESMALYEYEE